MSKSYKKISFTLDNDIIYSILQFIRLPENCDFSNFVKAMFINRCIEKHYLDEFGMPIILSTFDLNITPPSFDNSTTFNSSDIRECFNVESK